MRDVSQKKTVSSLWSFPNPSTDEIKVLRPILWIAFASCLSTIGYWLPAVVGFGMIPEDPDYRGFFMTIIFSPLILVGLIWSTVCLRMVWHRTPATLYGRLVYRALSVILVLITAAPFIHFGINLLLLWFHK